MQIPRFFSSLTFRLIALGVAVVLVGGVIRYFVGSDVLKAGILEIVSAQQQSLATYVAGDIDGKIARRRSLLQELANTIPLDMLEQPRELEHWLAQRHTTAPIFSLGLVVIPIHGRNAIADYPNVKGRLQLDFNDRDWFKAVRDTGGFAIGTPTIGRAALQAVINMAAPIKDTHGQPVAVLMGVTSLDMPGFMDLVQNNGIGKTGSFLVFSPGSQTIVTATEPELRLKPTPAPGVNRLHDRAMTGWRGTGITINAFGVETLATFVSIPSADWVVVARMPTAEALRPTDLLLKSIVRNSVLATLILVMVLVGILGVVFRPLRTSARQMRAMADGKTPLAKIAVVRPDEVGEMVESFNLLVDKLLVSETRMTYLAHHDALTGLPNRHSFMESMQQSVALADRQSNTLALLFIDLDGFKLINDQHGHEVGDQVLKLVATRLQESVRQSDLIGRLGGDEFVVLLTDNPDRQQAGMIANKVIARLSEPYIFKDVEAWLSASIGIAKFPEHSRNLQALFALADAAMYAAKRAGRSQYQFAHAPSPSQTMDLTQ